MGISFFIIDLKFYKVIKENLFYDKTKFVYNICNKN